MILKEDLKALATLIAGTFGVKDTDFSVAEDALTGEEYITILQSGENKKILLLPLLQREISNSDTASALTQEISNRIAADITLGTRMDGKINISDIAPSVGNFATKVMSQEAITNKFIADEAWITRIVDEKLAKTDVVSLPGDSKVLAASQKLVKDSVSELAANDVAVLRDATVANETEIHSNKTDIEDKLAIEVQAREEADTEIENDLSTFKATKGKTNGLAPLDSAGKLDAKYIPTMFNDVLFFNKVAATYEDIIGELPQRNLGARYVCVLDQFPEYYNTVVTNTNGDISGLITEPLSTGSIYCNRATKEIYTWNGGTGAGNRFEPIANNLTLGITEGTAFDGAKGQECLTDIETLKNYLPIVTTVDPSAAPEQIGRIYVNTTKQLMYISTGTSSVGDWVEFNA